MNYQIIYVDQFWGYFMDYAIYGKIYPLANFTTDFEEISFTPEDLLCYNYNSFDPDTSLTDNLPCYGQTDEATAMSVVCTVGSITCV